jgi:hypothetical protein
MLERQARNTYLKELGGALVLYVVVLCSAISIARSMEESLIRTILLLSPMVPIALVVWVIARAFRRMDEYVRLQSLEAFAISAAVTAGLSLTYGFLENVGFPRLSMFVVWPVMGAVWGIVSCTRRMSGR